VVLCGDAADEHRAAGTHVRRLEVRQVSEVDGRSEWGRHGPFLGLLGKSVRIPRTGGRSLSTARGQHQGAVVAVWSMSASR
jgi:hypothetical protein